MPFDLNFPFAYQPLDVSAVFRQTPDDFFVDEQLGFALSGQGEHLCLHIEKTNQNTVFVAKQLAEWAGIKQMDVGYCGLKDRHAVTRQWFSLYLGKREVDISALQIAGCTVLAVSKHDCKLRRGMHAGNAFCDSAAQLQGLGRCFSTALANGGRAGRAQLFLVSSVLGAAAAICSKWKPC
ncbi:MAG: tRNA pseudouridine(13) synthase TruD [Pseudomonadales bacterium]